MKFQRLLAAISSIVLGVGLHPYSASAQVQRTPGELEQLVSRVALYPDPLLAQVLTASTYYEQIPDAAQWADQHSYLTDGSLASAIAEDNLPWDASVEALLPFPAVLETMATSKLWTQQLGDAVLDQREFVMDAVQRMRQKARNFGYLQDGPQYRVKDTGLGIIEIAPVDPAFYVLPIYDPRIVFGGPRIGLAGAITFGPRTTIGVAFAPWGWGRSGFGWQAGAILIDGSPWRRTRENLSTYSHSYTVPQKATGSPVERHELRPTHSGRRNTES